MNEGCASDKNDSCLYHTYNPQNETEDGEAEPWDCLAVAISPLSKGFDNKSDEASYPAQKSKNNDDAPEWVWV